MAEINQNYYCFEFPGILDEIELARLYNLGFESFEEKEHTSEGYLPEDLFSDNMLDAIKQIAPFSNSTLIQQQNWNAIWESSFEPIDIDNRIHLRATFHSKVASAYEIIIDPKMAFGTGHHATTHMVLSEMLQLNLKEKSVLDFGCGSGILAIAAEKMGASSIKAIDYDPWSVENSNENAMLNNCNKIQVEQGDNLISEPGSFDVILANITRDILLENTHDIYRLLSENGYAIYSGFIPRDVFKIKSLLQTTGITTMKLVTRENWACLIWTK